MHLSSLSFRIMALISLAQVGMLATVYIFQENHNRTAFDKVPFHAEQASSIIIFAHDDILNKSYGDVNVNNKDKYMSFVKNIEENNPSLWYEYRSRDASLYYGKNPKADSNIDRQLFESIIKDNAFGGNKGNSLRSPSSSCTSISHSYLPSNTDIRTDAAHEYRIAVRCDDGYVLHGALGGLSPDYIVPDRFRNLYLAQETVDITFVAAILSVIIVLTPAVIYVVLSPVRRARRAAMSISTSDAHQKISLEALPHELAGLIEAFNSVLRRLGESRDRERRFRDSMAHELRTPLTIMRARLDDGLPLGSLKKELKADIFRMQSKISKLLAFSKIASSEGDYERVNLVKAVLAACIECRPAAEHAGIELRPEYPSDPIFVEANVTALMLTVTNLIINAIEHSQSKEPIEIDVDEAGRVRIRDHGTGLSADLMQACARHSEALEADNPILRNGLGLMICFAAMKFNRGSIYIEAPDDGGTAITLQFRLVQQ